jgi:heat shock protein HslJ
MKNKILSLKKYSLAKKLSCLYPVYASQILVLSGKSRNIANLKQKKMKTKNFLLAGIVLIFGCVSCGRKTTQSKSIAVIESITLTGTHWKLVELNGNAVDGNQPREPYITLTAEDSRISGCGSCNTFSGSYTIDSEAQKIHFSEVVSTLKICLKENVEPEFLQTLNGIDSYTIQDDVLTFNSVQKKPVAVFKEAK